MKTLLALASGAVLLPALAGGAFAAAPAVHLTTSIRALPHAPGTFRYAVTVRPVGGAARRVTLALGTLLPAAWTTPPYGCSANRDRTKLACDLGEVRGPRTLRFTGSAGGRPEVPVDVRAAAANAFPAGASLGSSTLSLGPGSGGRSASPAVESPAAVSPSAEPSAQPSAQPSTQPSAQSSVQSSASAAPADSPPAARPADGAVPMIRSRAGLPPGPEPKRGVRHRRPAHAAPAPAVSAAPAPAASAGAPAAGAPQPPAVPPVPSAAVVPPGIAPAAGATVPSILPSGPMAGRSPVTAPGAVPSRGEGVSELSELSPAGAMQAGRWSWATLVAVAIVTEAGLLWLVAGLTVWRRRQPRDGRHRRVPVRRVQLSRLIP